MGTNVPPRQLLPKAEGGSSSSSPTSFGGILMSGEPPAKRRCISSACMPCRKRKSKCDGNQPSCTACVDVYSSECHYDLDADHRRKGALKRDIAELKQTIQDQKIHIATIIESIRKSSEPDAEEIVHFIRSSSNELSVESLADNLQKLVLNKQSEPASEPTTSLEAELVSQKPQLNTYGTTSNLSFQTVDEDRAAMADRVEVWTKVTSDVGLINHLLDLYFTWSHPWYLLFSEEIFYHGMRDGKAKYCTPLLVNAVLSLGCQYSDRPEARADPNDHSTVGDHFFAEAKRLLIEDDDNSYLTTVQALGLMSIRQAQVGKDSSGRRYMAQMMSMAIELGLHTSYAAAAARPGGKLTLSEVEARRVTMWGCYVLETAWAICVGRISTLPRTAIQLEKPALNPALEGTLWKPHGTPGYEGHSSELEQPSYKYGILFQCTVLMEIIDEVIRLFYAPRDRITSRKLQQHHEKLQQWYKNLPPHLLIPKNRPTLPQVLTLHIFYHSCIIHLFRPFLRLSFVQSATPPRQICTESANIISDLFNIYRKTYGHRKTFVINTHCIMTAAIIHLVNVSGQQSGSANTWESEVYLAEAIRALSEMRPSSGLADRFLPIIQGLIYTWCKTIPAQVKQAMSDVQLNSPKSSISNNPTSKPTDKSDAIPRIQPRTNTTKAANADEPPDSPTFDGAGSRKVSAPELLGMAPRPARPARPDSNGSSSFGANGHRTGGPNTPHPQQMYWTPFTDQFEGLPLALPQGNGNEGLSHGMDITRMLDSGVDGDWPQWNRDGFTMGGEGGMRGDEGGGNGVAGLWDQGWDAGLT